MTAEERTLYREVCDYIYTNNVNFGVLSTREDYERVANTYGFQRWKLQVAFSKLKHDFIKNFDILGFAYGLTCCLIGLLIGSYL